MPSFFKQDLNIDTLNTTGDVEIEGNLTVTGTTTTVSTTNTVVSDKLLELANGTSGNPSGDAGIIIERGSSNNAAIIWDESADTFVVGTTTATGASTGDLSVTDAALKTAAITASGDITTTGHIILDDGGSLKEAGGTEAFTFNGSGEVTKIGTSSATNGQFLKYDGNKWIAAAVTGQVAGSVAADDITAGDAAINLATTTGNITIDAQGNDTDIIFKGTDNNQDTTFLTLDGSEAGKATFNAEVVAPSLDISGDVDVDGTLEADAITVGDVDLNTVIAGVTVTNATNSSHVLVTDNESTDEENLITFVENATSSTGNVGLEMDGHLTYNPSSGRLTATQLAGTLTTAAQTNITSVGTLTALQVDQINANASTLTITDSTDTGDLCTIAVGTHGATTITTVDDDAAAADLTLDIDGDIVLDSAEGKWRLKKDGSTKLKIDHGNAGDITFENSTQDKDIIFKGDDGGGVITALTLDMSEAGAATFNNKVVATELDISGNVDIDGTLEADAITVNETALDEFIQDTVGAMVSSNTETGITVTYEDGDGTLDFVVGSPTSLGTITQDTVTFTSSAQLDPLVIIQNTSNDADAARLRFVKDKGAAGADADGCGEIEFYGDDDAQNNIMFAKIRAEVADASDGDEGGRLMFGVATHDGEFQNGLVIEDGSEEDEIDVIIGNGINSVVTANGYSKALNGFLVPEQKSVHIETPMLATADHTATGITALLTASENLAIGDLVYVSGNGTVGKADADAVAKMPAIGLAVEAINANNPGPLLLQGMFRDDTFNFTAGNRLFASTTDGGITATVPSGSNDVAQAVGVALSDDVIYFKPDMTLVEIS